MYFGTWIDIMGKVKRKDKENKSLKMVLEGSNGHRPLTPMGDLDKVTLTQLANDLFRRLQDVEEQRREAQSLVSQQTKKIKNLENTLDEIVRRKDEHRDLMNEFFSGEIGWSQQLEEKHEEEKRHEIERMEKEIDELRARLEGERVKEEEKYAALMLDYLEQEGAARMLNQKVLRMRDRKEQRRLSNMSLILGLLEELDAQKARIEKEKAEAFERRRHSATQTEVSIANPGRVGSTQTDAVQYLHSTTQTFLLVKDTTDGATQTWKPHTQCSHTQTQTLTRSSSDGETQTCVSPISRNSLRRSNLKMGTGGTYFRHLQETVVFPSTAKAASKQNRDGHNKKHREFCTKYIITSDDTPLEYCPAVSDTPRTITPIEVKVTENNNNYMKHNVSFHEEIDVIHVFPDQAPPHQPTPPTARPLVKSRRPFHISGEVRSSRIPKSRSASATDIVNTAKAERPSRLPVVPMETRAPIGVAGSHPPLRITDTCRNHWVTPTKVHIVHIGKHNVKIPIKLPHKLTRMFCWKKQV